MPLVKNFPCNTCNLTFADSQTQRAHMREPWHVYNLKRRMTSLPPISADTYAENVATSLVSSKSRSPKVEIASLATKTRDDEELVEGSEASDNISSHETQADCCLFCSRAAENLEDNVQHMSSEHGLYIPHVQSLSSLETMVGYLRTVITEYNECLYCGITKQSTAGTRQHMLDKGHCMINLEREPELLEFWDLSDSDTQSADEDEESKSQTRTPDVTFSAISLQEEYVLPTGKVVGSKLKAREDRLAIRRSALAAKETSRQLVVRDSENGGNMHTTSKQAETPRDSQENVHDRAVTVRDATGLIGVSDQQIRSLITVQRKMQRQQAVVEASTAWAGELGGRHQKHYKVKMNLRAG